MTEVIRTDGAPAPLGPYSQGVRAGDWFYPCGQVPIDPATGEVVGADDATAAAERTLKNLGAILKAAGADYSNVVKATLYLADLEDFGAVNEVYAKYFGEPFPARTCVQSARLPKNVKLELDVVAYLGDS
jgi:2-iminobutanoate/2-iminopropanoate deaminase